MSDNQKTNPRAVIVIGGKQYLVQRNDIIDVELLKDAETLSFKPLLVYSGSQVKVGTPTVSGSEVKAKVVEPSIKDKKVTIVKFQAKKRVHKTQGHRQQKTRLQITSIGL